MSFTWKNIVAYTVWKCKICGEITDGDGIGRHLHEKHSLQSVHQSERTAYSPDFEYPNILATNKGLNDKEVSNED